MCSRGPLYLRNSNFKESGHLTWFEALCDTGAGDDIEAGDLELPGLELLSEGSLEVGVLLWQLWLEGLSSV